MKTKIIKDSIHGYISVNPIFSYIIDSPEFQRLKSIEQGSFRVLYPAARHDRFIHSLGTYHLATKFAEHFIENISEDINIKNINNEEINQIKDSFCYAALLHDIGHAPFSHTTENLFNIKTNSNSIPKINIHLHEAVKSISTNDAYVRFYNEFTTCSPSPHEIISAIILIKKSSDFLKESVNKIDLELSARMVLGCTYDYNEESNIPEDKKIILGIKNCFIRLLNSQTVDIDKIDYITRDTQMSGFENVPIDIERLIRSVTAIKLENDVWLYPAFRKNALSVIDNVFRAKTEQGLWMVSHPVVLYESELLTHCIHKLNDLISTDYINTVFSVEALSCSGVELQGKKYFLLNDIDIGADLRRFYNKDPLFNELYERNARRHPLWKSYYEYKYLFSDSKRNISEEDIFIYFKPLVDHLKTYEIFVLNQDSYMEILLDSVATSQVKDVAKFLFDFFNSKKLNFNLVLLASTNSFSPKFNPKSVYILFKDLPLHNANNYATYEFLKGSCTQEDTRRLFYMYSKTRFTKENLNEFKQALFDKIISSRVKPRV